MENCAGHIAGIAVMGSAKISYKSILIKKPFDKHIAKPFTGNITMISQLLLLKSELYKENLPTTILYSILVQNMDVKSQNFLLPVKLALRNVPRVIEQ